MSTANPGLACVESTRISPRANQIVASPPCIRNVRRYAVPPRPSGSGTQPVLDGDGDGDAAGFGAGLLAVGVGDGRSGVGAGSGVGDGSGAARRSSAAESGAVRAGAAVDNAELIPSQDAPTITEVATPQAKKYASPRGTPISCRRRSVHTMAQVLLVEDDHIMRGTLARSLTNCGHIVYAVGTALEALRRVASAAPDVVILDLGLPDLDGADALRMLRGISDTPIIIATARDDEAEIVRLLKAGADDYMVKPFTSAHLDARVTSVLRRSGRGAPAEPPTTIEAGTLRVDLAQRQAFLDGAALALTRKEFDLLAYVAARPGRVVSRRELLEEVWRQPSVGDDQTIDVHLYWLRRKLGESAARPKFLHTVRGVGVRFAVPD